MPHHLLEAFARDVALRVTIDRVADPHVISRHALRDGARSAPSLKEMPYHFLPSANFREDPIGRAVEVDGQRLAGGHRAGLFMSILGHIGMVVRSRDGNERKGVTKWRLWIGET